MCLWCIYRVSWCIYRVSMVYLPYVYGTQSLLASLRSVFTYILAFPFAINALPGIAAYVMLFFLFWVSGWHRGFHRVSLVSLSCTFGVYMVCPRCMYITP